MAPWTAFWDRNYFASLWPWLDAAMRNGFVRGGVTGVGLVTTWVGVKDLTNTFLTRWPSR